MKPWVKIEDDAYGHPKFLQAGGLAAFGAFVALISWSHRYGTDGFVNTEMAKRLVGAGLLRRLVAAGLLQSCDGGYIIPHYLQHQESEEEAQAAKLAYSEHQRLAGKARAAGASRAISGQFLGPSQTSRNEQKASSAPAGDDPKEQEHLSSSSGADELRAPPQKEGHGRERNDGFERVWQYYPRKVGKRDALKAYTVTRKRGHSLEDLLLATQRFAAAMASTEAEFIMHGARFFGDGQEWRDYLPPEHQQDEAAQRDFGVEL